MMVNLPCLMVSCTNFLRPTCSYTECLLSFLTGSCPTECTTASYSSFLYFDFTDPFITQGTVIPWTLLPVSLSAGHCVDSVDHSTPSFSGFYPEPCPISESSGIRQGSGYDHFSTFLCCNHFLIFLSFNVHQHLFRIINCSFLKNRIDDSQKFAGNHYQRLHLLKRIVHPCRVVYVKFLKFLRMCHHRLCRLE